MPRRAHPPFPSDLERARALGERLQLARLRRGVPQTEMAARVGVSRMTLIRLEAGVTSVSLDVFVRVLDVLGLSNDLDRIAAEDEIGRKLADLRLSRSPRTRKRAP